MDDEAKFFKSLGARIRELRQSAGYSQEDMISHGYSVRYWRTLLRICLLFATPMSEVVRDIDDIPKRSVRGRR
jgi:transcriptional regulator with XRE-family HTH domain